MSFKPLRPCRHPGCMRLVSGGFCDKHKPEPRQRSEESARWHKLYLLPAWTDLRNHQLVIEPFCRECSKHGIRLKATDVDHIEPHRGRLDLFLDASNLQSLCHGCHSAKTLSENRAKSAENY